VSKKKEIGIPSNASKKTKKLDEAYDKKNHVVEGSPADLKKDRELVKREKKNK
jgi:hypothetical protein